jgi:hypothetical protein
VEGDNFFALVSRLVNQNATHFFISRLIKALISLGYLLQCEVTRLGSICQMKPKVAGDKLLRALFSTAIGAQKIAALQ